MKFAIASIALLLAGCTAPQAPENARTAPDDTTSLANNSDVPTSAAKRGAGQENVDPMQIFRAFGTEPFWNVRVDGGQLTLTTPEDQVGVVMHGQRQAVDGGVDISGSKDGQPFLLSMHSGHCSDGMSDNQYEMTTTFSVGDTHYAGCAEAAM